MDDWLVNRLIETGKRHHLESEIRKLLKANALEHKRINIRELLARKGIAPAMVERILAKPYSGDVPTPPPHQRPDAAERKEMKKRMRGRRR